MTKEETFKLYDGDVILSFDPTKHIYTAKVKEAKPKIAYGTTSITGVINKPVLVNWAVKLTKEKTKSEAKRLGWTEFCKQLDEVLMTAGREHFAVSKQAREDGTAIHKVPEDILAGKELDVGAIERTEVKLGALAFLHFQSKYKLEPISLERKVFSIKYGYAGTVDYYGLLNGKLTVLDWKSSKAIYEDYPLQVAGYANALVEEGFKVEQTAVVRLGKDGVLEVRIDKDWKKNLPAFLGAREIYEYQMNMKGDNFDKRSSTKIIKK